MLVKQRVDSLLDIDWCQMFAQKFVQGIPQVVQRYAARLTTSSRSFPYLVQSDVRPHAVFRIFPARFGISASVGNFNGGGRYIDRVYE